MLAMVAKNSDNGNLDSKPKSSSGIWPFVAGAAFALLGILILLVVIGLIIGGVAVFTHVWSGTPNGGAWPPVEPNASANSSGTTGGNGTPWAGICQGEGGICGGPLNCCAGLNCRGGLCAKPASPNPPNPPTSCRASGQSCSAAQNCCAGLGCAQGICGSPIRPAPPLSCRVAGQSCTASQTCCTGSNCAQGTCTPQGGPGPLNNCKIINEACSLASPCCTGMQCTAGACQVSVGGASGCIDSDLQNNAAPGVTVRIVNGATVETRTDECIDADTRLEYDCLADGHISSQASACQFGCQDGACVDSAGPEPCAPNAPNCNPNPPGPNPQGGACQPVAAPCGAGPNGANYGTCCTGASCTNGLCQTTNPNPPGPNPPGPGPNPPASNCVDTDHGINYAQAGTVTVNGQNPKTDYCDNARFLEEYSCAAQGTALKTGYALPAGTICQDGAVIPRPGSSPACSDTDGGIMPDAKGTVTTTANGGGTDFCRNSGTVVEFSCDLGDWIATDYPCDSGQCVDGACVAGANPPVPNSCLAAGASCFGADAGCCTGLTCADSGVCAGAASPDTCTDTDHGRVPGTFGELKWRSFDINDTCIDASHVMENYCTPNGFMQEPIECLPGTTCYNGACQSSPTCLDSDGENISDIGHVTTPTGKAYDYCHNDTQVVEYVCQNGAAKSKSLPCPSGTTCNGGACWTKPNCTDSDGMDLYTAGTVTTDNGTYADTCDNANTVNEWICFGGALALNASLPCPAGTTCSNGACAYQEPASPPAGWVSGACADSDGGINIPQIGTIWYGNGLATTDTCAADDQLLEYYCNGTNMAYLRVNCVSGTCAHGTCTPLPGQGVPALTCADSDGGINYGVKGTMNTQNATYTDSCASANMLYEYYCDGSIGSVQTHDCGANSICLGGICTPFLYCNDSDGRFNSYTAGYVNWSGAVYNDYCVDSTHVREYDCVNNTIAWSNMLCQPGFPCADGRCT